MKLLIHDYAGHPFPVGLSRQLARRGHAVTHAFASELLTPRGALQRQEGDPAALTFTEVPMSPDYRANKYSFLKRRGYEVAYGRKLADLVRRVRPQVILSGNTPTEPQWKMIQAARDTGAVVFSWVQDFYSVAVDKLARRKIPVAGALAGAWYRHLDAKCFAASAGVVAITEDFIPILSGFGVTADKVTVIPNWAPLDELPLRPRHNFWSGRHDLDGKFVLLYSGTLAMKHNPDLLVQLALRFRHDREVRVVVISEGPGAEFLSKRKEEGGLDNLTVLPFQPFAELPEVLAAADILLAVLETDAGVFSVPSKVLTYHATNRPILAAIPGDNLAARIIRTEGSGLCVEPQDHAGWLKAADDLRANVKLRETMAASGRAYAEREFDLERITGRFEAIFEKALKGA